MSEDVVQFFGVMMSLVTTGLLAFAGVTAIRAFQRRIDRRADPGLNPDEVEALRAQLEDGEQLRHRVAELEERLDFAERLLAQHQETPRVAGGRE